MVRYKNWSYKVAKNKPEKIGKNMENFLLKIMTMKIIYIYANANVEIFLKQKVVI